MKLKQIRRKYKQLGQGMTECIILVALIAVSAIGVYSLFGQTLRNQTADLATEMSGKEAKNNLWTAQTNADTATTNASKTKNMGTYNDSNNRGGN